MERALKRHLAHGTFQSLTRKRSDAMRAIKGKGNKTTELRLRMALVRAGIEGWKLRPRGVFGNPDFVFHRRKLAVFVDGCFWHGCPECGHIPRTNRAFWRAKIERNRERDMHTAQRLRADGFLVVRIWEHELLDDIENCIMRLS